LPGIFGSSAHGKEHGWFNPWLAQQVKYVFQDAAVFSAAVLDMSQELNVETVGGCV